MSNDAVAIAAIVMAGVFLCVIAWQLLAIARTAVAREDADTDSLDERLRALEAIHRDAAADHAGDVTAP